jgi:DNA modification methylase
VNNAQILVGDALKGLQQLPDGGVRTCVTSPPYWGLRDYGNDGQLGLEPTPQEFVEKLCQVFDEVWRVLADDGTLWVNLGDSYASSSGMKQNRPQRDNSGGLVNNPRNSRGGQAWTEGTTVAVEKRFDVKPKDLVGIPWRFAFAMQDRGWYLRQDIIWAKPNPMPESVTDRCTKSHEYIFLFSKQPRYFFDSEAIREPLADSSIGRLQQDIDKQVGSERANGGGKTNGNMKAVARKVKKSDLTRGGFGRNGTPGRSDHQGPKDNDEMVLGGRNKRSVWNVGVASFKDAHFAVYPPALIEPCIRAGSAEGDTVLDPFSGSGTTGEVALKLGRNYVGCELNPDYAKLSEKRITEALGMFAEVEVK